MEEQKSNGAEMSLPVTLLAQYVKDLSFENPNPFASFTQQNAVQPTISVDIQAKAQNLGDNNFEVLLEIRAEAKHQNENMFLVELSYGGIARLENVKEEDFSPLLMIECPHLLFPFARNIIADVTRDGGFPPLFLSPVNFAVLYRQQLEQRSQPTETSPSKNDV